MDNDLYDQMDVNDVINVRNVRRHEPRVNLFEKYTEEEFLERFRLSKEVVQSLDDKLGNDIMMKSERNNLVPSLLQLATTLQFYATGNF